MKKTHNLYFPLLLTTFILSISTFCQAQNLGPSVGNWRAHYSYTEATCLSGNASQLFVGTHSGMFIYDRSENELMSYSKINGMSDVTIQAIATDPVTGYTILAYENANLDLFLNGKFINIPDLKISTVIGDKSVKNIQAYNGLAYLSTALGLVVVDMMKYEIAQTTQFFDGSEIGNVLASTIIGNNIYVTTTVGVFRTNLDNTFFQNYLTWNKINDSAFSNISGNAEHIYVVSADSNSVYTIKPDGTTALFLNFEKDVSYILIDKDGGVWIGAEYNGSEGFVSKYTSLAGIEQYNRAFFPTGIYVDDNNNLFFTDKDQTYTFGGLRERISDMESTSRTASGPLTYSAEDAWAHNGEVWLAHGRLNHHTWNGLGNTSFFSSYVNNTWTNYRDKVLDLHIPFLSDAIRITKNLSTRKVYVCNAWGGLTVLNEDFTLSQYKDTFFQNKIGDPNAYIASGMAFDNEGTLWINNFAAPKELLAMTKTGEWYRFHAPTNVNNYSSNVIVDNNDNKWFLSNYAGGVVIFNENKTFTNPSDDKSRTLRKGEGLGNLPSNNTTAIAKDLDGVIWIGTDNGVGVVDRPQETFEGTAEADLRPVDYDGDGYYTELFLGLPITSIAVDGANRKWIGTENSGVWLISEDAQKVILHFNVNNSPLPINTINAIDIDEVNGDVYFSTPKALMVYRSDAGTPNSEFAEELFVYPNPVPSGFEGMITIKGLKNNSDIRITDIYGQIVHHGTSNGGVAVWNGKDYTGKRAQSGVYLIFAIDNNGTTYKTGKLIFHE